VYPAWLRFRGGKGVATAAGIVFALHWTFGLTLLVIWAVMAFAALGDGDRANELFSILNPINRTSTRAGVHRYKVEPYVMAGDVYAAPGHVGRGGWTWYTGSAAWMQRAGIESILGLRRKGALLIVDPCIPRAWAGFSVRLRHGASVYDIEVQNPAGVARGVQSAELDGEPLVATPLHLRLKDDGQTHRLTVRLGEPAVPQPQAIGRPKRVQGS